MQLIRYVPLVEEEESSSNQMNNPLREIQHNKDTEQFLSKRHKQTVESRKRRSGHFLGEPGPIQDGGPQERRVRFNLKVTKVHRNKVKLSQDDLTRLWYTSEQVKDFKQETKDWTNDDRKVHPLYATWSHNLHRIYNSFCTVQNPEDVLAILDATPNVFHPSALGMERRAVPLVNEDIHARRWDIYMHVQRCQEAPYLDNFMRAQIIREGSRAISRPSRLYARQIAYMAAEAGN
jgi:hypothetical protein